MNKKITFLSLVVFFLAAKVSYSYAATKPATPSATPKTNVQSKIDDLKERLATKVAELRKTTSKAINGVVTQVTVSTITVDLGGKAMRIELTDDIKVAQMLKGKRTTLATDKVEKDDPVTVFGDYDTTLDLLKAKQIFIEDAHLPIRIVGTITKIDKTNFAFTVKTLDGQTYDVDVETTTKTNLWSKGGTVEKAGFSKISEGSFVTVLGTEDPKKTNYLFSSRVLLISNVQPTPTPTKDVSPTPTAKSTKSTVSPIPVKTTPTP